MCCFKRSFGFLQMKAYKSKTKIIFCNFFWYFKRKSIHVHPKKKSTLYLYSKCAFLHQNWKALYFVLCWTISQSKIGASWWIFSKNVPYPPPGNGNVGLGPRDLSEFGFKVGENSPPPKKIAGEISAKNKNNFFGTWVFLRFKLKLQYFVQESAAKFTIFYLL